MGCPDPAVGAFAMRLFDRYVLREMVGPAVAAVLAFVVLLTGHVLYSVVDVLAGKGVPLGSILRFALLKTPDAAVLALPVSTLLGCSLALNRLASDNELVPMVAAGVSGYRMMVPAVLLGLAATGASFCLKEYAVPRADREAEALYRSVLVLQKTMVFRPEQFVETGAGWTFIAREVDDDAAVLKGVRGFKLNHGEMPWVMTAPTARFSGRRLLAEDTRFYVFTPPDSLDSLVGDLDIDLESVSQQAYSGQEMANTPLREIMEQKRAAVGNPSATRPLDLEIHSRLSLTFACLVLAMLAGPVGLRFGRGQQLAGVLATLIMAFLYYVIMLGSKLVADAGVVPIPVAIWAQDALIAAGSLLAMRRF